MVWKKVEKTIAGTFYFEKANDEETKKLADSWKGIRGTSHFDVNAFKPKYFEKELSSQGAEIINTGQMAVLHLDNKNESIENVLEPESEDDVRRIANFNFDILDRIEKVYRDNISEHWIKIAVFYKDNYLLLEIKVENYSMLGKAIRNKYPQCYIFQEEVFDRKAAEVYGKACENLKKTEIYYFGGWYYVKNQWKFLNSTMPNVETDTELCFDMNLVNLFLPNFLAVSSEKNKLWVLLLYALWAQLAKFYEVENMDGLRSVLYLSAPTGTGKTTLAKIFAKALLADNAKVELRFDDTKASLQESIINKKDLLCLVDDFYAKGTKLEDADSKSKVSEITRIVGDGMVKGKMGANRKPLPDRKYRGSLIATGEYIDLNTHSSYLRCWLLNFPANSIYFNDNLTFLQKNSNIAKSFISQWIYFLEKNQVFILQNLSISHADCLKEVRTKYPQEYPRFHSNVTTFLVIAKLFIAFSKQNHFDIDGEIIFDAIWHEADEQLKLLKGISPEEVFKKAIFEALDNAYLRIVDCENTFKKYECDGFYEGSFIFVITAKLETVIEKYADKNQYGIKFNDGLKISLANMGLLHKVGGKFNLKYSKNREVEPKRPRMYKIEIKGSNNNGE